jgi:hypothetical protein
VLLLVVNVGVVVLMMMNMNDWIPYFWQTSQPVEYQRRQQQQKEKQNMRTNSARGGTHIQ